MMSNRMKSYHEAYENIMSQYKIFDDMITVGIKEMTAGDDDREIECRKGCYACCSLMVIGEDISGIAGAMWIREQDRKFRRKIETRIRKFNAKVSKSGIFKDIQTTKELVSEASPLADRYWDVMFSCPFLDNHECSIYPVRSIECRSLLLYKSDCQCPYMTRIDPKTPVRIMLPTVQEAFSYYRNDFYREFGNILGLQNININLFPTMVGIYLHILDRIS